MSSATVRSSTTSYIPQRFYPILQIWLTFHLCLHRWGFEGCGGILDITDIHLLGEIFRKHDVVRCDVPYPFQSLQCLPLDDNSPPSVQYVSTWGDSSLLVVASLNALLRINISVDVLHCQTLINFISGHLLIL
ncbi:hypothetical protein AB6A40_006607 [Gnathostoma spinigerum]|uniref:Uncharacterized protein n=1 Tax=Gnathostoma spinigerum TaxID=75299 RepID=A0ABD6EIU0_9BILA